MCAGEALEASHAALGTTPRSLNHEGPSYSRRGAVRVVFGLILVLPICILATEVRQDSDAIGDAYTRQDIIRIIDWYAKQHQLDPLLLRAVVKAESDFRHDARSHKGALGLMQLMPSTVEQYHVGDPFDPLQNIEAGSRRLRHLLVLYRGNVALTLAAYNAGVHRIKGRRVPKIRETRNYVRKVLRHYRHLRHKHSKLKPTYVRGPSGHRHIHAASTSRLEPTPRRHGNE